MHKSARPAENRREVDRLTARLTVLSFDGDGAAHTGESYADLGRKGMIIGPYHILIAGHARSRGLVITGHLGEFGRVDGLRSENWLPA